jgi:hypothetical protein
MKQLELLGTNLIELKAGKVKCPCCGHAVRAYCKTLDKRLVSLFEDIGLYLQQNKATTFNPRWVWQDDHHKINDFQKLHYWYLIKRKKAGQWEITPSGVKFLQGKRTLPKRVWIFNNEHVDHSEERVSIDQLDERWQQERSDWTWDFIPYQYKESI